MRPLLGLGLVVAPIVELYVAIKVGERIGPLATVALLILFAVLGSALVRREGTRTWRSLREAVAAGRLPAREVADGALVLLAGALLIVPGFVSGVLGLLILLPPVRALLRRLLTAYTGRRLAGGLVPGPLGPSGSARRPPRTGDGRVVEGEVVEGGVVDDPRPGQP